MSTNEGCGTTTAVTNGSCPPCHLGRQQQGTQAKGASESQRAFWRENGTGTQGVESYRASRNLDRDVLELDTSPAVETVTMPGGGGKPPRDVPFPPAHRAVLLGLCYCRGPKQHISRFVITPTFLVIETFPDE